MMETASAQPSNLKELEWLVENRSRNQRSTLRLYRLIVDNKEKLSNYPGQKFRRAIAQHLLGVAFSLWRAVFLADLKLEVGSMMRDAEGFLRELIENNTITYVQDKKSKEWTYRYYVSNADLRLKMIKEALEGKGFTFDYPDADTKNTNPQEKWSNIQSALDQAIDIFEELLKKVRSQ